MTPIFAVRFTNHDERLVDEREHEVEDIFGQQRICAADRLGSRQIEAADEHTKTLEEQLLVVR